MRVLIGALVPDPKELATFFQKIRGQDRFKVRKQIDAEGTYTLPAHELLKAMG